MQGYATDTMTFGEVYASNPFVLSYELFPPKTPEGMEALEANLIRLIEFKPHFITCTYGAGGSTRDKTLETLAMVQRLTDIPVASHLTCVGATKDGIRAYLHKAASQGIQNIVAIRGDAPKDQDEFEVVDPDLRYGADLVKLIREEFPHFGVAVGGYPETHPEAANTEADMEHLKYKVDCGADVVITQLFYDNDDFYRFRDQCNSIGIDVPVVPGVLPVTSFKQIDRITSLCGAKLPNMFRTALQDAGEDVECQFQVGVEHAIDQTSDLLAHGVPGMHFYVLNKSRATSEVLSAVTLPA